MVDGVPISEAAVAMWTEQLRPAADRLGATFFETTTAMAFADLAARGAEIAVIEVGLGGRLDSTNVVRPLASVVTKIEMDHQKYLGETLDGDREGKGLDRQAGRAVRHWGDPSGIVEVLRREAAAAVRSIAPARLTPTSGWFRRSALRGRPRACGAGISAGTRRWRRAVLRALPSPYRPDRSRHCARASPRPRFPGRLDRRGKWLFDVAHNPDGVAALCRALERARAPPGRSTPWSRFWATRRGPRCWSSWTRSWTGACSP